jgi:uncharacterized repeat protein (TIGR01451 family)
MPSMPSRRPLQSITGLVLLYHLLAAAAAAAQPSLVTRFAGFDDGNGVLDCGETVTIRTGFFTNNSDSPPLEGTVFLPSSGTDGLVFLVGSLAIDNVAIPTVGCLGTIVRGNGPFDSTGEVDFTCAADPPDDSSWVLSLVYKAVYENPNDASFTAAARAVLTDGRRFNDSDFETIPASACPTSPELLEVEKTVQGSGAPGSVLLFTITVRNPTTIEAGNVQITDTVPDHTVFNPGASSPGWSCPGSGPGALCELAVGSIPAQGSTTRFFAVTIDSPLPAGVQSIANTACAREGPNRVFDCGSVSTPTSGRPVLSTSKTLTSGTAAPGATLVFTIAVANVGDQGSGVFTLTDRPAERLLRRRREHRRVDLRSGNRAGEHLQPDPPAPAGRLLDGRPVRARRRQPSARGGHLDRQHRLCRRPGRAPRLQHGDDPDQRHAEPQPDQDRRGVCRPGQRPHLHAPPPEHRQPERLERHRDRGRSRLHDLRSRLERARLDLLALGRRRLELLARDRNPRRRTRGRSRLRRPGREPPPRRRDRDRQPRLRVGPRSSPVLRLDRDARDGPPADRARQDARRHRPGPARRDAPLSGCG